MYSQCETKPSSREEGVLGELLGSSEDSPRTLIFYKQQHEYLLEDLNKMKGLRETLEQSLREKERNEHVYVGEIAKLTQENRRLTRNTSRESANMEYLKNIVVRYLSLGNGSERRQVLSAILTVLQLTPDEVNKVKHKLSPGWLGKVNIHKKTNGTKLGYYTLPILSNISPKVLYLSIYSRNRPKQVNNQSELVS
eukprot:sb/3470919/